MALSRTQLSGRVDAGWDDLLDLLARKVALRSVSAEGIAGPNMHRSAQFVADELTKAGLPARVEQSTNPDGTPGAFEVVGEKHVADDAPTVLLYAHHDVQPVPDASQWKTDPWKLTTVGDRAFGRGSVDDGGGIAIHVGALTALGEDLPVNVKVFIEGEEEMGSESFIPFIQAHQKAFDADVIVVCDSGNWRPTTPSLTTSLRGAAECDVTVRVLGHPVHSGQYGGPILDANTSAALLIASLYNEHGSVDVPGLLSQPVVGGLQQDLDPDQLREDTSVVPGYEFAGEGSLASRLWVKPSLAVIGFDAHPVDGSFNVLADTARFRLSLRTAPSQDAGQALDVLADYLVANAPFGAQVSVEKIDAGTGWAMDPDSDVAADAEKALADGYGTAPINQGQGGSIPFIPELQKIFPKAKVLVTGPEDPVSAAHSPNESISLPGLKGGVLAEALLLQSLANK
jgi:acetylornithine deacetylase/succinyl-diaminopimelate desuccinylase-like protein